MSKRSDGFERKPRDFYPTPAIAVEPLIPHLQPGTTFDEPCAGDGALIDALETHGHICVAASDIMPMRSDIEQFDVFDITETEADVFITNPPWDVKILHPLIVHLSDIKPTWLLFYSDWAFTKQAYQYADRCRAIIALGRISWMQNGTSGMDNCSWLCA